MPRRNLEAFRKYLNFEVTYEKNNVVFTSSRGTRVRWMF